jgi:hypothetical protein
MHRLRQAASVHLGPAPPGICSYTNDVARAAETCQALLQAKTAAAE